jgi:CheY-like chemotaxis protein
LIPIVSTKGYRINGDILSSILIADDSRAVRGVLKTCLERPQLDLVEAVDGEDAVQKAAEHKPDLIILDFSMPRMNGLDAARVLHPQLPGVPIILFTLYAETVPRATLVAAGVNAIVSKANITDLLNQVESMLPRN